MKKILVSMLAVILCAFSFSACNSTTPEVETDPMLDLGTVSYSLGFDDVMTEGIADAGFQTINFTRDWTNNKWGEFEADNLAYVDVDGIEDKALQVGLKLPDPTNVWYALGLSFPKTTTYTGNFKDFSKFAFKYVSNVDYSEIVTNEDASIYVQVAIKSVDKFVEVEGTDPVQKAFQFDIPFGIKNTNGSVEIMSYDIPQDTLDQIAAFDGSLYLDWVMFAFEDLTGDNWTPGKMTIGQFSFIA